MIKIEDLCKKYNSSKLLFSVPMRPLRSALGIIHFTSSNDAYIPVFCRINETRYSILDGYKITMEPIQEGYAKENFYQNDFNSMLNHGVIVVFQQLNEGSA